MGTTQSSMPQAVESLDSFTDKIKWSSLKPKLNTGDLIFFKSARPSPTTAGEWTSCNVVIKFSKEKLVSVVNAAQHLVTPSEILKHSVAESGTVRIIDVDEKMRYQSAPGELTYSAMCVFKLEDFKLNTESAELLGAWIKNVLGNDQRRMPLDMPRKAAIEQSQELVLDSSELFAPALAAEFFRAIGVFSKDIELNAITSPEKLRAELDKCGKIKLGSPIILEVDPSHKPRSWDTTLHAHGDYGRHTSHADMVDSQGHAEWMLNIPPNPAQSFQMAKNIRDQAYEMKDDDEKRERLKERARNLFEVALMNENYYSTGHITDQKRIEEIEKNLQMLSE